MHYFFECPLYNVPRQILKTKLGPDMNLDIIQHQSASLSIEENTDIFKIVNKYLKNTNRFN